MRSSRGKTRAAGKIVRGDEVCPDGSLATEYVCKEFLKRFDTCQMALYTRRRLLASGSKDSDFEVVLDAMKSAMVLIDRLTGQLRDECLNVERGMVCLEVSKGEDYSLDA